VSSKDKSPETRAEVQESAPARTIKWVPILSWGVTALLVAVLLLVLFKVNPFTPEKDNEPAINAAETTEIPLPVVDVAQKNYAIPRLAQFDTLIPDGNRQYPIKYTVQQGDSIFSIAKQFNLKPESVLWANYDLLNDDPTLISPGWRLTIPPTDGIYYKWKEGDTLEKVAEKYYAEVDDIISWPSNHLDITNPDTANVEYVMIPDGWREIVAWIKPLEFAPRSGVTRVVSGPGGCQAPATGPVGSTAFIWPVGNHFLSGYDYAPYHLAIDIAAATGTPVVASDAGTVIYSGWNDTGYGYLIEIDHNNGYQTIYGHMSSLAVSCGQSVGQGQYIGAAGSTGKSTGAHLHFEVRLNGGFVNPWYVLGN
jgi:murein DD-endopeptidase MepM/ murein hydrolase activator NlpD